MLHDNREDRAPGPPGVPPGSGGARGRPGAPGRGVSPRTTVGPVHLTVADLERSLAYYREQIGLDVLDLASDGARLGAGGDELVVLVEEPGARPPRNATGLYHFALLLPIRAGLAAGSLMPCATACHSSGCPTTS